jgi:hypothetical protein
MAKWLAQMKAGYKASHPVSSLKALLQHYAAKIGQAEADLQARVFGEFASASSTTDGRA